VINRCPFCRGRIFFSEGKTSCPSCRIDIQIWFHRYGGAPWHIAPQRKPAAVQRKRPAGMIRSRRD
jgi:hypothetical protein